MWWKARNYSEKAIFCAHNPKNCNGNYLNNYCVENHVGPLCEECKVDYSDKKKSYSRDYNYECNLCEEN